MARPKAQIERQQTGFRLRPELVKELRYLSVDTGKPVNILIEEALEAFLCSRGRKVPSAGADPGDR